VLLFFGNALIALLHGDAFVAHRIAAYRARICIAPAQCRSSSARRLTRLLLVAFAALSHRSLPRGHLFSTSGKLLFFCKALDAPVARCLLDVIASQLTARASVKHKRSAALFCKALDAPFARRLRCVSHRSTPRWHL
jgi:hypothetical protein